MKRPGDEGFADDSSKRHKMTGPSPVLHVRALPAYITEAELTSLVYPFGQVMKCLILPQKRQAFVQMESAEASTRALAAFEITPPSIRSKTVYFQFSGRQTVESKNQGNFNNGMAGAMAGGAGGAGNEQANSILLVTIQNAVVPVSLDNLHQIFKPYGDVLKIVMFQKKSGANQVQSLVQLSTVEAAMNARFQLEGKDMFQGCCHLSLHYSSRTSLQVREPFGRDYTQPQQPQYGQTPSLFGGQQQQQMGGMQQMGQQMGGPALGGMQQQFGGPPQMGGMGGGMHMGGNMGGGSPVVLVSKLEPDQINPDYLFTLFGVYGDVLRVKILFNKRDSALIQFTNGAQAASAQQSLNHAEIFAQGQQIVVSTSKHSEVKVGSDGKDAGAAQLTKDFTGDPGHRYKRTSFINPKNVNAPSQVLHVSNLYDGASEDELTQLFSAMQNGQAPVVEFFKNNRKMAYVCMDSVQSAVRALTSLHNTPLGSVQWPMRVSFSHKDPASVQSSA